MTRFTEEALQWQAENYPDTERCVHYWLLAEQVGKYSTGTCRKCGEGKVFDNAPLQEYNGWVRNDSESIKQDRIKGGK